MVAIKGRKSNKNPPILSHEFVIQNHADIVSCIAMVFVIGLMVQITSPWAYLFTAVHHNVSTSETVDLTVPTKYTTGWKDACAVFFYFLITIVVHAVFQEYLVDKIAKRLHLSKIKIAKFNESSQLIIFYVLSILWGVDIIIRDNLLTNITSLWKDYPMLMSFSLKFFFIGQIAYWLHCYPELYFQRIKKEHMITPIILATVGLFFTFGAYFLNFQQVGLIFLVLHYFGDVFQHGARVIYFVNQKEHVARMAFFVANSVYIFVRMATFALAGLVFVFGFSQVESSLDYTTGKFNIPLVQYSVLALIAVFQCYLLYIYFTRQSKRESENSAPVVSKSKSKPKQKKREGKKSTVSEDELSESDHAKEQKNNLRSRTAVKAK